MDDTRSQDVAVTDASRLVTQKELEAGLYRQELRMFPILKNYWATRSLPGDDARRSAAMHALLWRICIAAMPTAAAGGAGIIAIITALLAWGQMQILDQQNEFIRNQTETALLATLANEDAAAVIRSRALKNLTEMMTGMDSKKVTDYSGCNFDNLILKDFDFSGATLYQCTFKGADLTEANFDDANLREAEFYGATLRKAKMRKVDLTKSALSGADLNGADLTDAWLIEVKLLLQFLDGKNIEAASLKGTILSGVNLDGALLQGVDLSQTRGLTQKQFDNAHVITDDMTILPEGITLPKNND